MWTCSCNPFAPPPRQNVNSNPNIVFFLSLSAVVPRGFILWSQAEMCLPTPSLEMHIMHKVGTMKWTGWIQCNSTFTIQPEGPIFPYIVSVFTMFPVSLKRKMQVGMRGKCLSHVWFDTCRNTVRKGDSLPFLMGNNKNSPQSKFKCYTQIAVPLQIRTDRDLEGGLWWDFCELKGKVKKEQWWSLGNLNGSNWNWHLQRWQ